MPDSNPSSGPEDVHITSCRGPGKSLIKLKHPIPQQEKCCFPPTALHGGSTALGQLAACQTRARKVIYTLPCKLQQSNLMVRKVQHFSLHKLPGEWEIHTYSTKCHNYMGWTWISWFQFLKKLNEGRIWIFALPFFFCSLTVCLP